MKGKVQPTVLLLLLLFAVFAGCKKEDDFVPPDTGSDEPETSIEFEALQSDTIPLSGVFVGITPNEFDRDNGIFLFTGTTNGRGKVKFESLSALTYYWGATFASSGGAVVREGQITMEIGDEVDREIKF